MNFWGFHGARLSDEQSVRGGEFRKRTWVIKIFSPLLFYAPETHLKGIHKMYTDRVVKMRTWRLFYHKLERDLGEYILYVGLFLSVGLSKAILTIS